jgi:pimeloyl-ACP methyl ester carboxylesterase
MRIQVMQSVVVPICWCRTVFWHFNFGASHPTNSLYTRVMKRWWKAIVFGIFFLAAAGVAWGFVQVLSLQPPVTEPNINTRRAARVYEEKTNFASISTYSLENGVYSATGSTSRVLVMLPDLGTGAWSFAPWLQSLSLERHAVSYRNMNGAKAAQNATLSDYEQDARTGILQASKGRKIVLLGQGIGAYFALKIAAENPAWLEGLILVAPYAPRPWNGVQLGVAKFLGEQIYNGVYASSQSAAEFWKVNFGNGIIAPKLKTLWLPEALKRQPFEFRGAWQASLFDPMPELPNWYAALEKGKFPVLHMIARFDTSNPIGGQRLLREQLEKNLSGRYRVALLNSGKYISLDWRWAEAARIIEAFSRDLKLEKNFIENETALDPLTDPPDR